MPSINAQSNSLPEKDVMLMVILILVNVELGDWSC